MSNSGGGGGPFLFLSGFEAAESTDVVDAFSPSRLTRPRASLRPSDEGRGDFSPGMWMEGRISFFCFEAGRISSRSTGTPRDTRKSRRMRERTQSGGCNGGGATSCVHSDLLRSVRNIDRASSADADMLGISDNEGYMSLMYGCVAVIISSSESRSSKFRTGCARPKSVVHHQGGHC